MHGAAHNSRGVEKARHWQQLVGADVHLVVRLEGRGDDAICALDSEHLLRARPRGGGGDSANGLEPYGMLHSTSPWL